TFHLRLNLGTISRHDVWHVSHHLHLAGHAYALALVGGSCLFGSPILRPVGHEEEHMRFSLIEIELYRLSAACDSILVHYDVYNFSAYGYRLAGVFVGIGGGYGRWGRVLGKSESRQARHTHDHDKGSDSLHSYIPVPWFGSSQKASQIQEIGPHCRGPIIPTNI